VAFEVSGWNRFARPGFLLEFCYPDPVADGRPVARDERPFSGYSRVHLSSPDRSELYFEVVRFDDLTPQDEYRLHRPHLEQRFGADSISPLTEARLGDWPAFAYSFGWVEAERAMKRSVLLVEVRGESYRIIFDPRSELNTRVIATLAEPTC
jgi:hypothetical protein